MVKKIVTPNYCPKAHYCSLFRPDCKPCVDGGFYSGRLASCVVNGKSTYRKRKHSLARLKAKSKGVKK